MEGLALFVVLGVPLSIISAFIAGARGLSAFGTFLLGLLFWPAALMYAVLGTPNKIKIEGQSIDISNDVKCPFCAEAIKPEAVVCKHCGRDIEKEDKWQFKMQAENKNDEKQYY